MRGYRGAPVTIDGGRTTVTCGVDDGIWVAVAAPGKRAQVVELPRWRGGVGGMELVASADGRYVALFIYSGQSSQGYEAFTLAPELRHLGGLRERRGHGSAPVFSPGSSWLATLIDGRDPRVRGSGEYFEEIQADDAGDRLIVDWAELHVQHLPGATIESVPVGVEIPRSTPLDDVLDWNTYDAVQFSSENTVVLAMPWGEQLSVSLPPKAPVTSRGYDSRAR